MKTYRQKRKRTIGGWYTKTYNRIKHDNMAKFNLELPFTKEEFINWIDNNYREKFKGLFDNYVNSNCDKMLNPSIDRIDDYESYVFDNMQLITWEENYIKSLHSEKSTFRGKSVAKFDEQNNEIARYSSISEAERVTGIEQRVIRYCCKTNSTLNHFYWKYVENKIGNNKIGVFNNLWSVS